MRLFLSMEFPRQEYLRGLPFPSPADLPDAETEPTSPALASGFFTAEPRGKPSYVCIYIYTHTHIYIQRENIYCLTKTGHCNQNKIEMREISEDKEIIVFWADKTHPLNVTRGW